jgi:flagellar protein FliO/FliZ
MGNVVLYLRVAVSLAVGLGLLSVAARAARRGGLGSRGVRTTALIDVVARHGLGRSSSLVVVNVADRALVLGVTDTSITLLADVDPEDMDEDPAAPGMVPAEGVLRTPQTAWKDTLEQLREKTVRRSS